MNANTTCCENMFTYWVAKYFMWNTVRIEGTGLDFF